WRGLPVGKRDQRQHGGAPRSHYREDAGDQAADHQYGHPQDDRRRRRAPVVHGIALREDRRDRLMALVVISEFMDAPAVERLRARFDVDYRPKLVDDVAALEAALPGADAWIVRN